MVNEEDHLRIQVMQSGLNLSSAWEQVNRIDDVIDEKATYAFHERLGYLTACPTNVGTGMRVSVMLHSPALVITRQIDKVFRSLQKISLAVRGLYGEGSQAMGDFYQISNQVTLGRTEAELIRQVSDIVPVIIDYERQAREFLIKESHENLHDRVSRAYGILRTAQTISSEETKGSKGVGSRFAGHHGWCPFYLASSLASRAHKAWTTFGGKNFDNSSSLATEAICLISELATWANSPSAIIKSVSTSGASRRLAIIIVNSAAMSVMGRTPRTMIRAPHCFTNATASPVKVRISTFSRWAVASWINWCRSSAVNSVSFSTFTPTPTISRSKSRLARSITFRCPSVIGSKEPG